MPNISDMRESKFLRKTDVEPPVVLTIADCVQMNVAMADSPKPENKWCLVFKEDFKPMVLNMVNASTIAEVTGSEETEGWKGHQIEVYFDANIFFGGKRTGGLRVRHPQQAAPAPTQRPPAGTYRPAAGQSSGGSTKSTLKAQFKNHPDFGKAFQANDVNAYFINNFGAKLDDLSEEQAKDALADFDNIIETLVMPF